MSFFEKLLAPFQSALRQSVESFIRLETMDDEFTLAAQDGSLISYLKIDGSYIRAIDQESDKRLFIEAVQRAAHSIDLPLIAERIETEGELAVIREMGLYGAQGQLFGEPKPWA